MSAAKITLFVQEWLNFADGDFKVANDQFRDDMPAYHTICFLCQAATEKYLKALLLADGKPLQKTHDLLELLNSAVKQYAQMAQLSNEAALLNEYITAGRYPGIIPFSALTRTDAQQALAAAESIRIAVLQQLTS